VRVRSYVLILILAIAVGGAACHEESGPAVKSLTFKGNSVFNDARLKAVLATKSSGWLPWSAKHYFDRAEFENDLKRLQAFYSDRGYPHARVSKVDVNLNEKKDAVDLAITIDEGKPVLVDAVNFQGFEDLAQPGRAELNNVPLKAGQPRDRENMRATRDMASRLLRDNGYPNALVDVVEQPATNGDHVTILVRADPGPKSTYGEIGIVGLQSVSDHVIFRELTFKPGDLYRDSEVVKSQKRLLELGLFQFGHIGPATNDRTASQLPMRVTLSEGKARQLKASLGYGSEERLRGDIQWSHLNFFGDARRLNAETKYSSIDRGVKFDLTQPFFLHRGVSLNFSGIGWRTNQLTYSSDTYGGRATVILHSDTGFAGPREPTHREVRVGYVNEFVRSRITESLGDLSLRAERIALGLNPDTGESSGRLAALDVDVDRSAVDDAMNPKKGTIASMHFMHAARALGGTYHFQEVVLEGRTFFPIGDAVVWANRGRLGGLFGSSVNDLPFSSRYFLGGSTSVRGWGRYEISPLDPSGLPIGGRSLFEWSSELRFPVRGNLSGVAFLDAGTVGSASNVWTNIDMHYAVGPGVRYRTPIGPVRVDVGYQLNPIPGLLINGVPETRHWRVHFSIGQAF
jgi:outer membrane protein insertion porin family/translocation and assembly module TamA